MNNGALEFTGLGDITSIIGERPGETIGCTHSKEEAGGCGTTESCTYCGAILAILEAQKGKPSIKEARLILGRDEKAYDLRIWASPFVINNEDFTAVTLQDIQNEKWRSFLERIFFHDILNTATGLQGTIDLLINYKEKVNTDELMERIGNITKNLIEEIQSQQLLISAENDILELSPSVFSSLEILNDVVKTYENQELTKGKILVIAPHSKDVEITSDRTLLRRIIGNMTKNAIEAVPENSTITLGCKVEGEKINYWAHNPGFIPRKIQLQIFNRSFSTKGLGRGLGTYSMKLLSSFLNGKVTFTTSKDSGTTFNITIPINVNKKK
jgi:signal transduction histidine kinase